MVRFYTLYTFIYFLYTLSVCAKLPHTTKQCLESSSCSVLSPVSQYETQ